MKKRNDFNNIQDYIFYLVNEKNILNLKNITIFIIGIGIIAFISIELIGGSKLDGENAFIGTEFTYDYMIEVLVKNGYEESELRAMDESRVISLFNEIFYNTKNQNAGNTKNKEYPSTLSETLKQDYYMLASKGDFKSIITDFENKKLEYSFSELYNKDLINIYNDAYYLNTSINKKDKYLESQVLSSMRDPQMFLYGLLLSSEESRRDIFKDKISLSPILVNNNIRVDYVDSGSLESVNTSEKFKNDHRFKEVARYINEGDFIIYRFNFTIDGNNLVAYIYKNISDLKLGFYGIYTPPGVTNNYGYLTTMEWIELDNYIYSDSQNNNNYDSTPYENTGETSDEDIEDTEDAISTEVNTDTNDESNEGEVYINTNNSTNNDESIN